MNEAESERKELQEFAAYLALRLQEPTRKPNGLKFGRGKDLSEHLSSLVSLLEDVADTFQVAKDDFDARADPNKPKRSLEENWPKTEEDESPFDYGALTGAGLEDWSEYWERHYARDAKNPGTNRRKTRHPDRKGLPPIKPLHSVYYEICHWWINVARLGAFNPSFGYEVELPYQFEYCNPSARLLILIAQWLDRGYGISNAASVHDHMRRNKPPKI